MTNEHDDTDWAAVHAAEEATAEFNKFLLLNGLLSTLALVSEQLHLNLIENGLPDLAGELSGRIDAVRAAYVQATDGLPPPGGDG